MSTRGTEYLAVSVTKIAQSENPKEEAKFQILEHLCHIRGHLEGPTTEELKKSNDMRFEAHQAALKEVYDPLYAAIEKGHELREKGDCSLLELLKGAVDGMDKKDPPNAAT